MTGRPGARYPRTISKRTFVAYCPICGIVRTMIMAFGVDGETGGDPTDWSLIVMDERGHTLATTGGSWGDIKGTGQ